MSMARLDASLNALEQPFTQWLLDEGMASTDAEVESTISTAWAGITAMLDECSEFQLTCVDTHALDHLLDTIPVPDDPDLAADLVGAVLVPVGMFIDFLFDSDRWTGTEDDYVDASSMIMEFIDGDEPDVEPADELEALLALPMTSQLQDLVRAVGEGRDLDEARRLAPDEKLWLVATQYGLIDVQSGRAVAAPHADEWPHHTTDIEDKATELRSVAALLIALTFLDADPESQTGRLGCSRISPGGVSPTRPPTTSSTTDSSQLWKSVWRSSMNYWMGRLRGTLTKLGLEGSMTMCCGASPDSFRSGRSGKPRGKLLANTSIRSR